MILKAVRSAFILTWMVSIPSIFGFQLTRNSPCERHQAYSANGVMTPKRSPILPSQGMARNTRLESIWGSSHPSSSKGDDDEEVEKETEETPAEDTVVGTSMTSTDESPDDTTESSAVGTEKSLLALVNEIGNSFRAMAQKSTEKGYQSEDQYKKILHAAKACVYYSLFIIYRAYRGFFVLLPATFREVYGRMEAAMNTGNLSLEEIGFDENGKDVASSTPKWRTKFTVSILTTVITISYIVGGALKMVTKFAKTIAKTSDVPKSFGAAADEVMNIEGRISNVGKVNGEGKTSGLTP